MAFQAERVAQERDRANLEAERASKEAAAAKQVSEFLISLFKGSDPTEARGDSLTARQLLDRGAKRLETELSQQPELQAQLMLHRFPQSISDWGCTEIPIALRSERSTSGGSRSVNPTLGHSQRTWLLAML